MLFNRDIKILLKCKVSKFVKVPFMQLEDKKPPRCYVDSKNPLPLYSIVRSNHQTFFYTRNDSIYFYKVSLNDTEMITPFYDYKKEVYRMVKFEYINTGTIYGIISHYRAINGDTYFVYLSKYKDSSETNIVVYNYTKNMIIYREKFEWLNKLSFAIPIGNSLLVSLSPSGEVIWIKVIDVTKGLTNENMALFRMSLIQYFIDIVHYMSDKISKREITRLNRIAHKIMNGYASYKSVEYTRDYEVIATASIHNNDTVFYKGFEIRFKKIKLKSLNTIIEGALSLSFNLENDKMVIKVGTCKEGRIVINRSAINLPSNEYWTIGVYKLDNKYNISSSQLYSVSKVSEKYMIIDGVMYYSHPNTPKLYQGYELNRKVSYVYDDNNISILKDRNTYLVCLDLPYSKIDYDPAIYVTLKSHFEIHMIDIKKLKNKIRDRQRDNSGDLPDIMVFSEEDLIEAVGFRDEILEFLHDRYGIKLLPGSYDYWYYVDEEEGHMYYLILYEAENRYKNAIILKYSLRNDSRLSTITAYSKLSPNEAGNDENLLKTKIVNLTIQRSINRFYIAKLLKDHVNYMKGLICNYANKMAIEIKGSFFSLNDVKYNRSSLLKYYVDHFERISHANKSRRYNVITWNIHGKIGGSNIDVCVMFVISELAVTKSVKASG